MNEKIVLARAPKKEEVPIRGERRGRQVTKLFRRPLPTSQPKLARVDLNRDRLSGARIGCRLLTHRVPIVADLRARGKSPAGRPLMLLRTCPRAPNDGA